MAPIRILLIEDDPGIRQLVETCVRGLGYDFDFAEDGETGLSKALSEPYALVLLDVMLPKLDGLEVCQRLRASKSDVAIMMLTARREEIDRVLGLELGADDYLTKPFSVPEFRARIKAITRRLGKKDPPATEDAAPEPIVYKDLTIDRYRQRALLMGKILPLTTIEFDLLVYLAAHPGRPFSRRELLEAIWGYSVEGYENNVTTHINRLRNKLEADVSNPTYIFTQRGTGYHFAEKV